MDRRRHLIHFVNDAVDMGFAPMQKLPQALVLGHARAAPRQILKAENRLFQAGEPLCRLHRRSSLNAGVDMSKVA